MHDYHSIHTFINDYVTVLKTIHANDNASMIAIKLDNEEFCLPATLNNFSQRADGLQYGLQSQIRILAQQRRKNILKGIDTQNEQVFVNNQNEMYRFNDEFKNHLEQLQNTVVDKSTGKIIRYIRAIIDALEVYEDIRTEKYFSNITFRLLAVLKHIQKQLCCISANIQKMLDKNTAVIEQHLRKVQVKLNNYDSDMRNKLAKYVSRDIRPPVLVVPCPTTTYWPELFSQMHSSNAVIDKKD